MKDEGNIMITIGDLKKAIQQDQILIRIGLGTTHRIDNCQISPTKHDNELFYITSINYEKASGALILNIE